MRHDQKIEAKLPYEPPTVRRIQIVPGELAVVGCKTKMVGMGPTFGACVSTMCMAVGS